MPSFDPCPDRHLAPSPWVVRFAPLIPPAGRVLDLACGHGRHARYMAQRGHRVLATDIDTAGLADMADHDLIECLAADLEGEPWPFAPGQFAGIVVANYLHRPHFPRLVETLTDQGVLLIDTFGLGNEKLGRPRNLDFLLRPGELLEAFAPTLTIVAYEYGSEQEPRPAVRQRLCAAKGAGPYALS